MLHKTDLGSVMLEKLYKNPGEILEGSHFGERFSMKVVIPNHERIVAQYYSDLLKTSLNQINNNLDLPSYFKHFGIEVKFEKQCEVAFYNDQKKLDEGIRESIKMFGPIIIKNVYLDDSRRNDGHRNRFPQLKFHVDRSMAQTEHHSYYHRDPFDPEQIEPRKSSTLFIPNVVGYLQGVKEKKYSITQKGVLISHIDLFHEENVQELIGKIIVEHAWNEPRGTGEISIIDNTTTLHSSYYRIPSVKGYRIGVRYVA